MSLSALEIIQLDELGEPRNGPVQQELQKISGVISVPQVFYNGDFIGENSDVQDMHKQGQLASKLGM
jgi:glutaredoxin